MNLQEIKQAIAAGKKVYWSNTSYEVIKDNKGQYLIKCTNGSAIGLTWMDETTLNGEEKDFFVEQPNVHLYTQRNKVVVIDAKTGKKWANEYFDTVEEAEQFCKDNGLNITIDPLYQTQIQETIKVGSKVKFAKELTAGENKFEMTVIELNGDRCLIETDINLPFNPQSTVMVKDLIPAPEEMELPRKTYTFDEINAKYNYKKWYVGQLSLDSFEKGTTTHYAFAYKKTGEKSKYGGDIYSETERVYFELIAPFTYQECKNPYKR